MASPISNSSTLREKRRRRLSLPKESLRRFSSGAVGETGSAAASRLRTAIPGKLPFRRGELRRVSLSKRPGHRRQRLICLRFGASLAPRMAIKAEVDGREAKAPTERYRRTRLRVVGRFRHELQGTKYLRRGRRHRCR